MVNLALRLLVSVFAIYCVNYLTIIASLRVNVSPVRVGFVWVAVHSILTMIVRRENLGESVSHFELAIKSSAKESLVGVEATVFHGMKSCRRFAVVKSFVR